MKRYDSKNIGFIVLILLLICGLLLYALYTINQEKKNLAINLNNQNQEILEFKELINIKENENNEIKIALETEQKKNGNFQTQIGEITGTVGALEKLRNTDKELLQKYSKVYFLNENYIPSELSKINKDFLSESKRELEFHKKAEPFLNNLLINSKEAGLSLQITSSYRSFVSQSSLKSNYKVIYGTGANRFSADQGYSEHQLGTALDFITPKLGGSLIGFEKTPEYSWLINNAHKYGFILSYPKGNTFYQFEPWHWRFVGVKLATKLYEEKENFYDLEQREINKYLINIFD